MKRLLTCLLAGVICLGAARAAPAAAATADGEEVELRSASVVVDGLTLFDVIGIQSYPASRRAAAIAERIRAVARDPAFDVEQLHLREEDSGTVIVAGQTSLLTVTEADARTQGLERKLISELFLDRVKGAVLEYRRERSAAYLWDSAIRSAIATALLALLVWLARVLLRRLQTIFTVRYQGRLDKLEAGSFGMLDAEQMRIVIDHALQVLWLLVSFLALVAFANYALANFPWTRHVSRQLLDLVLVPLQTMGQAVVASIPNLAFIAILILVVRYLLGMTRLFFVGIRRGAIRIAGFYPEWAMTTFKLVRIGVIAFAVVIAYPYIPGSSSEAFKGISVFAGVLLSLGSSTIIANTLAGYSLIYRRAFSVGDRVKVGQHVGDVQQIGQQVTVLNTAKNESVVIPNSVILGSDIVNYSVQARKKQLILHSSVTIGYDTPWRQVEAMLLDAAARTPGLLPEPAAFVLKTKLDDFYVAYEINAYCGNASRMARLLSTLHENILDVFNEHGVQIMSPHFEAQPEAAVMVPKAKWFEAPARRPD